MAEVFGACLETPRRQAESILFSIVVSCRSVMLNCDSFERFLQDICNANLRNLWHSTQH
jgi:hypothetical protein